MEKTRITLKGMWFHTRDSQGAIRKQGQVIGANSKGEYVCQFYSFLDGAPTDIIRVERSYMKNWSFYLSDETMRATYDRETSDD